MRFPTAILLKKIKCNFIDAIAIATFFESTLLTIFALLQRGSEAAAITVSNSFWRKLKIHQLIFLGRSSLLERISIYHVATVNSVQYFFATESGISLSVFDELPRKLEFEYALLPENSEFTNQFEISIADSITI